MKDGFFRVASATPDIKVSDTVYNADKIIELIKKAASYEVNFVVFPELCITGYTCGDLFFQEQLLISAETALMRICDETKDIDIISVVGLPYKSGTILYNCAVVIYKGEILGFVPKMYIPNYSEFYEKRYFSPGCDYKVEKFNGKEVPLGSRIIFECENLPYIKIGIEVCEDLWSLIPPSCYLSRDGANIIGNPSASNEYVGKSKSRRDLVVMQSSKLIAAYVYSSSGIGESTTDMVFSGHNIIAEYGEVLKESERFKNELIYTDVDLQKLENEKSKLKRFPNQEQVHKVYFKMEPKNLKLCREIDKMPFVSLDEKELNESCEEILKLQSIGLATRLRHIGCEKVVVGLSGGLDSTLALLVCVRTFDMLKLSRKGIIAVTMPCFGTSERTLKNAKNLVSAYDVTLKKVPIARSVNEHFSSIQQPDDCFDVVYENVQARERTQILMSIANKEKGIVIGTGDLSELALGWSTYNGDHMSMYAVNASVPKTIVRYLINYESMHQFIGYKNVLDNILNLTISPELVPADKNGKLQSTEDIIGPYELHDFFIYYFLRYGFTPLKICRLAEKAFEGVYKREEITKWLKVFLKRFFANQFKRSCMPDSPKVCEITLSPRGDFRMPSDACVEDWLRELEEQNL